MRILMVTAHFPYPPDNGASIRDFNLIKLISRRNDITVLSFYEQSSRLAHKPELKKYCRLLDPVYRISTRSKFLRFKNALFNPLYPVRPFHAVHYYHPRMAAAVAQATAREEYDLVQIGFTHMAQYHRFVPPGVAKVLDTHNAEHRMIARYSEITGNLLSKFYLAYQSRKLKRYEARVIPHFDCCICVSENDRAELEKVCPPGTRFEVIPNGVDTEFFTPAPAGDNQTIDILYHGAMSVGMNIDAATYFLKEILPLVRRRIPDANFTIAGAGPPSSLRAAALRAGNVTVTGRVEDMRPLIASAKVVVVPSRVGSGTKLKILESFAAGRAVIATPVGAQGIGAEHGKEIMVADSPAGFADSVVRILTDSSLRRMLEVKARELVVSKYDWRNFGEKLQGIYSAAVANRRVRTASG